MIYSWFDFVDNQSLVYAGWGNNTLFFLLGGILRIQHAFMFHFECMAEQMGGYKSVLFKSPIKKATLRTDYRENQTSKSYNKLHS
jgi:hypothetical protein